jgi:hypothetical protein
MGRGKKASSETPQKKTRRNGGSSGRLVENDKTTIEVFFSPAKGII